VAAALAPSVSRLPALLLTPALHAQADGIDFVATALPGLRGTHRLCGATIVESYPFGPRFGCPLNVTGFGNGAGMDLGISLSPNAITDPDLLLECLEEAFDELTAPFTRAGQPPPARAEVEMVDVVDVERGDAPANGSSNAGLRHG
jgi:diacylglycerol O-acyltransferase